MIFSTLHTWWCYWVFLYTTCQLIIVMKAIWVGWLLRESLLDLDLHTSKILLEIVLLWLDLFHIIFCITICLAWVPTIRSRSYWFADSTKLHDWLRWLCTWSTSFSLHIIYRHPLGWTGRNDQFLCFFKLIVQYQVAYVSIIFILQTVNVINLEHVWVTFLQFKN